MLSTQLGTATPRGGNPEEEEEEEADDLGTFTLLISQSDPDQLRATLMELEDGTFELPEAGAVQLASNLP